MKADWSVYNLRGLRQPVKDQVAAHKDLSEPVKAFILAEIDTLPESCLGVCLNAFGQTHDGDHVLRNVQITISGIKL